MDRRIYNSISVDDSKCTGCINCIRRCPTKAIRVRKGKAVIEQNRCINCGECIRVCKSRAIYSNYDCFENINNFKHKVALAPASLFGQFNFVNEPEKILNGLVNVGFDDFFEVARGSDVVSRLTRQGLQIFTLPKPCISTACPACVELILMCFHSLVGNLANFLTASQIAAKLAREEAVKKTGLKEDEIGIFLISPCPAHVGDVKNGLYTKGKNIDGVLSVSDVAIRMMSLNIEDVEIKKSIIASSSGMNCAISGGEVKATNNSRVISVDGMENVISVLKALEDGKLPDVEFVELNACPGGCVGGALNIENPFLAKSIINKLSKEVLGYQINGTDCTDRDDSFYECDEPWKPNDDYYKLDEDFEKAFIKMRQLEEVKSELLGLDCGICGAPSCKDFAEDVVKGKSDIHACVRFSHKKRGKNK